MAEVARILVVDDDDDSRDITAATLSAGDFDAISLAASAAEAYAQLDLERDEEGTPPAFDVILLDIVMPQVDGIEACARIRATRRYRDVPILMVSSLRDIQSLNQAFVAGANDYVTKPVERIELLARVRSALRLKRELDRRRAREAALLERNRDLQAPVLDVDNPARQAFDRRLGTLSRAQNTHAVLALSVLGLDSYRALHGEDGAASLLGQIERMLKDLPAPLGFAFYDFGEGLYLVIGECTGRDRLERLGAEAQGVLASLRIPHGNSAEGDHVAIGWAAADGRGAELLSAPATAIEQARRAHALTGEAA